MAQRKWMSWKLNMNIFPKKVQYLIAEFILNEKINKKINKKEIILLYTYPEYINKKLKGYYYPEKIMKKKLELHNYLFKRDNES